jgi:hypothetical protein
VNRWNWEDRNDEPHFSKNGQAMVIADDHSNLRRPDVVILLMVNDCHVLISSLIGCWVDHLGDLEVRQR